MPLGASLANHLPPVCSKDSLGLLCLGSSLSLPFLQPVDDTESDYDCEHGSEKSHLLYPCQFALGEAINSDLPSLSLEVNHPDGFRIVSGHTPSLLHPSNIVKQYSFPFGILEVVATTMEVITNVDLVVLT
tara:strand:- start:38 stop:430 length:393 start_codon:yes stop_codon:yes gene_type:complete